MADRKKPVLIALPDQDADVTPDTAPVIIDSGMPGAPPARPAAMEQAVALAARRMSLGLRLFWAALLGFGSLVASVWAWDFVTALLARAPVLGYAATGLIAVLGLVALGFALREWLAFSRLRRLDHLRGDAETALAGADLAGARAVTTRLLALYQGREEMRWASERFREARADTLDADAHLALAEAELMAPLDRDAERAVETASRQVATVTAIVPIALADLFTALAANLRMIRRIAEIYGGRSGSFGSWRLARAVMAHLVATGAVAVGDDLIGSVAGGGVVSKLSRRFGEGVINGALTARVGIAAMEVCRPLPFRATKRPSVTGLVKRALVGLFGRR